MRLYEHKDQASLDRDSEIKRMCCERCDSSRFAVYYDPVARGYHVECESCGEVAGGMR